MRKDNKGKDISTKIIISLCALAVWVSEDMILGMLHSVPLSAFNLL